MAKSKMPYKAIEVVIYGILCIETQVLIKVDLSLENIKNEFDLSMYSVNEYEICKLKITI